MYNNDETIFVYSEVMVFALVKVLQKSRINRVSTNTESDLF